MNQAIPKVGYWSAITLAALVILIDIGMIASTLLFPMTSLNSIEAYAASFNSLQMLPFIPSLILGPVFVVWMLAIHQFAPAEKKLQSQSAVAFSIISAAVLSFHYYLQLSFVQQGLVNKQLEGLWQFVAPNPYSLFWTFAALGYGFMGIALMFAVPLFKERTIRGLFLANGLVGLGFLVGNALGLFVANILASFVWGVLFPVVTVLLAQKFKKQI
jgi:hypothetical protein